MFVHFRQNTLNGTVLSSQQVKDGLGVLPFTLSVETSRLLIPLMMLLQRLNKAFQECDYVTENPKMVEHIRTHNKCTEIEIIKLYEDLFDVKINRNGFGFYDIKFPKRIRNGEFFCDDTLMERIRKNFNVF
jgi:hypothetical protein